MQHTIKLIRQQEAWLTDDTVAAVSMQMMCIILRSSEYADEQTNMWTSHEHDDRHVTAGILANEFLDNSLKRMISRRLQWQYQQSLQTPFLRQLVQQEDAKLDAGVRDSIRKCASDILHFPESRVTALSLSYFASLFYITLSWLTAVSFIHSLERFSAAA